MKFVFSFFCKIKNNPKELNIIIFGFFMNFIASIVFYIQGENKSLLLSTFIFCIFLFLYGLLFLKKEKNHIVAIYNNKGDEQFISCKNYDQAIIRSEEATQENHVECVLILNVQYNHFQNQIRNKKCTGVVSYVSNSFCPERCSHLFEEAPLNAIQCFLDTGFHSYFFFLNRIPDLKKKDPNCT